MSRSAFTLLELLLTLAVLAAIAAVAIPRAGGMLGGRRLVRAADQLRVEMTRLRVKAMREGRPMMFEAQLQQGAFRVRPFYSLSDATESADRPSGPSALVSGAKQANVAQGVGPAGGGANAGGPATANSGREPKRIELAEGVTVADVSVVSAARAAEITRSGAGQQTQGWSRPILFYPDGTTSTAAVTLHHETTGSLVVRLRGITGEATISDGNAAPSESIP